MLADRPGAVHIPTTLYRDSLRWLQYRLHWFGQAGRMVSTTNKGRLGIADLGNGDQGSPEREWSEASRAKGQAQRNSRVDPLPGAIDAREREDLPKYPGQHRETLRRFSQRPRGGLGATSKHGRVGVFPTHLHGPRSRAQFGTYPSAEFSTGRRWYEELVDLREWSSGLLGRVHEESEEACKEDVANVDSRAAEIRDAEIRRFTSLRSRSRERGSLYLQREAHSADRYDRS